jgi:hypothetical protein
VKPKTATRRPRWKDRPWWKNFLIGLAVGVLMIAILGVVREKVNAAPLPASTSATSVTFRECVGPDHETPCKAWAKKEVRQFKAGTLGNSGAGTLIRNPKRLI